MKITEIDGRISAIVTQVREINTTLPKSVEDSRNRQDRLRLLQSELDYLKEQISKLQ